jgi:hypothetical protein
MRVWIWALIGTCLTALAVLLLAACSPAPTPCSPTGIVNKGKVPTVEASPTSSFIGFMTGGVPRPGVPTAFQWFVSRMQGGPQLQIQAGENGSSSHFQVQVPRSGVSGSNDVYVTRLKFPSAGCWNLSLETGSAQGTLTLQVKKPKKA